jgi:hypothetical protein
MALFRLEGNIPSAVEILFNDGTATLPSKADVDAKIQELKDAETASTNARTSAINKLKALGLTDAEIEAL